MKIIANISVFLLTICLSLVLVQITNTVTPVRAAVVAGSYNLPNKKPVPIEKKLSYPGFIIGTWAGYMPREEHVSMYLTFKEDGTVIVDYSPPSSDGVTRGRIFEKSFNFSD